MNPRSGFLADFLPFVPPGEDRGQILLELTRQDMRQSLFIQDQMEVLLKRQEIASAVSRMGKQISQDFAGQSVVLVGVLKGACLFLSDLARQIDLNATFDFIAVRSYGTKKVTAGEVQLIKDVTTPLRDQNVILVEDILDTGLTLTFLRRHLQQHQPRSMKIAALLDKPSRRMAPVEADYVGFKVPDRFVVGYGLDFNERFRNLPDICILEEGEQE